MGRLHIYNLSGSDNSKITITEVNELQMFSSSTEQLQMYEQLIDIYLSEYMEQVVSKMEVSDTPFEKYKGLVVSMEEAQYAISRPRFVLSENGKRSVSELYEVIEQRTALSKEAGVRLPLDNICENFGFGLLERFIIAFSAMPLINLSYEKTFGYINDNVKFSAPTLELALNIFAGGDLSLVPTLSSVLVKYFFEENKQNPLKSALRLRDYYAYLLSGMGYYSNYDFMTMTSMNEMGFLCYPKQYDEICGIISSDISITVLVEGDEGCGRRHLIKQAALVTRNPVLMVDLQAYCKEEEKDSADIDIVNQLIMRQCYICIYGVTDESDMKQLRHLCDIAGKVARLLFVCADKGTDAASQLERNVYSIQLGELSHDERFGLWKTFGFGNDDILHEISGKYRFRPAQIVTAANAVKDRLQLSARKEEISLFDECCARLTENCMGDKAQRIESKFTLDDLVLPDEEKSQIREACAHIKYRHLVYDKWNFESRLSYGKGLTVLFAGPPGTGKTMAATIMARELGLPAYRVDISRVMSKYIGETEKSLGEIFDIAQQSNAILFFDETDALFGKRSEIKDSHDKYANVETSFLLQRLESFDGVVLMSTNLLQNIDDAFMRRISYIVNFPFPDASRRLELWKKMFPPEMPVDGELDLEYLASQFELSGALIKNTVMSAAFLAADEGEAVNMRHILRAVRKQLSKQGRVLLREDLGKYSMFF